MAYKDPEEARLYGLNYRRTHKSQNNAACRRYKDRNRAQVRQRDRERHQARRQANPEPQRVQDKAYYWRHREERLEKNRLWRLANPEKIQENSRLYYHGNTGQCLANARKWRHNNPEKLAARARHRRAAKSRAPHNDLTHAQWLEIQEAQGHRCYYCGKRCKGRLTQDHITPLSQGGSHTLHNVIGACRSCNSKKHIGAPLTPVQPLLLTIAKARKKKGS